MVRLVVFVFLTTENSWVKKSTEFCYFSTFK